MRVAKPILFTLIAAVAAPLSAQQARVPVIQTVSPPPPPVMIAPAPPMIRAVEPAKPLPPVVFQIEIWGGSEKLWAGQLRVGNYSGASFNSTVNEAPEACAADKSNLGYYAPNFGRTISLRLNRRGYSEANPQYSVSASWTRPGATCEELGSSTVSFDRPFTLDAAGKAELKGDGGLMVRLSRVK